MSRGKRRGYGLFFSVQDRTPMTNTLLLHREDSLGGELHPIFPIWANKRWCVYEKICYTFLLWSVYQITALVKVVGLILQRRVCRSMVGQQQMIGWPQLVIQDLAEMIIGLKCQAKLYCFRLWIYDASSLLAIGLIYFPYKTCTLSLYSAAPCSNLFIIWSQFLWPLAIFYW